MMKKTAKIKSDFVSILSLFTSFSTLICCALPTLLVTLGLGVVVAGVISNIPALVELSRHKIWVFIIAGLMLGVNFWLMYGRKRNQVCEIDADGRETACDTAARWSKIVLWVSIGIYGVGAFMAFVYFPLRQVVGG